MQRASIIVRADWDAEAGVWVASSTEIDGLAAEAETLEALSAKVADVVADLIEANGIEVAGPHVPVHIMAERLVRVPVRG